jgi:hypothetical protein
MVRNLTMRYHGRMLRMIAALVAASACSATVCVIGVLA